MDSSCTKMLTFVLLLLLLARYVDLLRLTSCQVPEKNTHCVLECKTMDFNDPVSFRHGTKAVGSCNSQNKNHCSSHFFPHYNLSQSSLSGYITRFHIAKLDRQRDEGDWSCSYGNLASKTINLTVHSRPRTVDIKTKSKTLTVLEIECICNCLYPVNSVEIRIEITNQDKSHDIERSLPIKQLNSSTSRCEKEEKILFGVVEIDKDNWQGRTIDIECFCKDTVTRHTTKKKITHVFEEIDNSTNINITIPTNINITIPIYQKVIIPLICCGFGSILFTGLIYYCIFFMFKRMSKRDENLCRELKYFKENLKAYRIRSGVIYVLFWIIVVVCSYAVAVTLKSVISVPCTKDTMYPDNSACNYVTTITSISLLLGVLLASVSVAVLWSIFIITYYRYKKWQRASQESEEEPIELGEKAKTLIANSKIKIKERVYEGTFVKTKGYLQGWKKSLQYGVVMYTGMFGDGKTTNAYHIMNKWVEEYGYKPIILNKVRKIDKLITANDKFVVLIEGPVSNFVRNRNEDGEMTENLQSMMTWVRNGRTKIVLTDKTKTIYDHGVYCRDIEMFDEKFRIDLSDNTYRLTKAEKEQILRNHCQVNKIEICASYPEEHKQPTMITKEEKHAAQSVGSFSSRISKRKQKESIQQKGDISEDKEDQANANLSDKESFNAQCEMLNGGRSRKDNSVGEQLHEYDICEDNIPDKSIEWDNRHDTNAKVIFFKEKQVKRTSSKQHKTEESETLLNKTLQDDEVVTVEDQCKSSEQTPFAKTELVQISEQTLHEITQTEPAFGYPKTCALFCKSKKFIRLGLNFFIQPSERIIEDIDQLNYLKGREYEVLLTLFKERGKTRFQKDKYKTALENLKGRYIKQDEDGDYIFINNSFYVAFGLSLAKKDPKAVLSECSWNFLKHHTKIDGEEYIKDLTYLTITPDLQPLIKSKFLKDLTTESANRCCGYISRLGEAFLKDTLDEGPNEGKIKTTLRKSCSMKRGVFVHACKYENRLLMIELWNRYKNYIPKNVVEDCRRLMRNEPLKILLTQWLDEDSFGKRQAEI